MPPLREIRLNAFDMVCPGHIQQGMWTHPRDRSSHFNEIDHWTDLARRLEAGLFDAVFFADVLGVYDVLGGSPDAALRAGVQIPVNDPTLVIPAMAAVTRHLGFGVTCNLTYENPFLFARRMSTLDHLTGGRIGWNIVTGYLDSAARAMGLDRQMAHDDRYDMADEFMSVVYKLWEGSWDDAAVVADRDRGLFVDPAHVRKVRHDGPQYRLDAMHLCAPSPQRTPLLYQAGSSARGRDFAACHAECVFLNGQKQADVAATVADLQARAMARGRAPDDVHVFMGATLIVGRTEDEAREKLAEYRSHASSEGALAHAAASMGIDFSRFDPDEPIEAGGSQAITSNIDIIKRAAGPQWTLRKLLEQMTLGSRQQPWVGSSEQIADQMIEWVDRTGITGYNLSRTVTPDCIDDVARLLVPVLQEKGVYKTGYGEGTLRRRTSGRDRLPASHPAAAFRHPAA